MVIWYMVSWPPLPALNVAHPKHHGITESSQPGAVPGGTVRALACMMQDTVYHVPVQL
jgi:hypothetical protein